MNRFIIDAETDGLYGDFLTVAVLVADKEGQVIEYFYGGIPSQISQASHPWVLEYVLPHLGEFEAFEDEHALFERVWTLWTKYRDQVRCYADVSHPIESRFFSQMVITDLPQRMMEGPFPLIDIASLLLAVGHDPLVDRQTLIKSWTQPLHNAFNDVCLSNLVLDYLKNKGLDV